MKPKKINEYSYIVEKEGDMNVPVKIFASEKLMEKIQEDRCIDQGINAATLPGIQGFSIMMPDAHQGYGFSIGGVAAMHEHEGCISPGGIGFDINCLPAGSKILTEHGYTKNIEDFEQNFEETNISSNGFNLKAMKVTEKIMTLDKDKCVVNKEPAFFMKKKHDGKLFTVLTRYGYELSMTDDHPVLTQRGMVKPLELKETDKIAIEPFKGVDFEDVKEEILIEESEFSGQQKKHLLERELLPLKTTNKKFPTIVKLMGFLYGDGTIYYSGYNGFVNFYGQEEDLKEIKSAIESLGFAAGIYSRERSHKIPTRYGEVKFTSNNCELHVNSISLAKLFEKLGFPIGNKTNKEYLIPDWLMNSSVWIKRLFLSGFFGAELSKPRTHTKTGYGCPTISMNKNDSVKENGRKFLIQIIHMLETFGVDVHKLNERKDYHNKNGKTTRFKLLISSKEENLLKLYAKIGYSFCKKRETLAKIAILYMKKKKLETETRKAIAQRVKEYKKIGLKLKEVQEIIGENIVNNRFIERHYYHDADHRLRLDFISFNDFVDEKISELKEHGCLLDEVAKVSYRMFNDWVYDFNVPNTHNFIANGIYTSNCGVRLLTTNLTKEDIYPHIEKVLDKIFKYVPPGAGNKSQFRFSEEEFLEILNNGPCAVLKKDIGEQEDIDNCESNGCLEGADVTKVSEKAMQRGKAQLGTLGSGNHFLEIQFVDKIFDEKTAKVMGLQKDQCVILIHTGSRGFGHQICSDYIRKMEDEQPEIMKSIPDKNLIYAPAQSQLAKDYFGAMKAAANFAWTNRHVIGHQTRKAFKELFGEEIEVKTVYDVAHNIAKLETHEVDGKEVGVYVHRKGATRAFPPNHPEIPKKYHETGQPIFIPGSMGTSSYVLAGTETAMKESFGSTAHGAGRMMSRKQAKETWTGRQLKEDLRKNKIYIKAASMKGISEEAPLAYKDVDEVVRVSDKAGIGKLVAQLKPIGVVKG